MKIIRPEGATLENSSEDYTILHKAGDILSTLGRDLLLYHYTGLLQKETGRKINLRQLIEIANILYRMANEQYTVE